MSNFNKEFRFISPRNLWMKIELRPLCLGFYWDIKLSAKWNRRLVNLNYSLGFRILTAFITMRKILFCYALFFSLTGLISKWYRWNTMAKTSWLTRLTSLSFIHSPSASISFNGLCLFNRKKYNYEIITGWVFLLPLQYQIKIKLKRPVIYFLLVCIYGN